MLHGTRRSEGIIFLLPKIAKTGSIALMHRRAQKLHGFKAKRLIAAARSACGRPSRGRHRTDCQHGRRLLRRHFTGCQCLTAQGPVILTAASMAQVSAPVILSAASVAVGSMAVVSPVRSWQTAPASVGGRAATRSASNILAVFTTASILPCPMAFIPKERRLAIAVPTTAAQRERSKLAAVAELYWSALGSRRSRLPGLNPDSKSHA